MIESEPMFENRGGVSVLRPEFLFETYRYWADHTGTTPTQKDRDLRIYFKLKAQFERE